MKGLISILFFLFFIAEVTLANSSPMVIIVDAGDDATICFGETLDLAMLEASISGDVDDGLWFTNGDGLFLPSATTNGIFSTTTQYQPGPQDMAAGSFTLILVSDDPDGNGPMVEVSDQVTITFMNAPALVCNNSINVSLAENCEEEVDVFMLVANPTTPYDKYIISVFNENGEIIPDNILTSNHLGTMVSFEVGHDCTNNICDGEIMVSDNIPPFLNCTDVTVDCKLGTGPNETGIPIPFYATATEIDANTYNVTDLDACGDVTLSYIDTEIEQLCNTGYIMMILRNWHAEDENGNESSCEQEILVNPLPLDSVLAPLDFDNNPNPALSCTGNWIALPSGYPSPETTGSPEFFSCSNIEAPYTDIEFELCGNGFKIVRQWFVIDWCTNQNLDINQIIMVSDDEGPLFDCPSSMTLPVEAYDCTSGDFEFEFMDTVIDCSDYTFDIQLFNLDGENITSEYSNGNTLSGIPLGEYTIEYIATDECANSSFCSSTLTVVDESAPFAICEGYTSVSVTSTGLADLFATSLDDSSFDNCELVNMEVAKMTDECGWGLSFGPKVQFCCEEIGDTIQVAFRVTDAVGLTNICMANVFVEDNIDPMITCPDDITIDCTQFYDLEDLSPFGTMVNATTNSTPIIIDGVVMGYGGFYNDNCISTYTEAVTTNIDCGIGTISRLFETTDEFGMTASCVQTITIVNNDPFLQSDINWPANYVMEGCDTLQALPQITGEPTYIDNDACAQVSATYTDQIFYISGEACIKILRTWQVIDWCQFDAENNTGLWSYLQEIKLKNTIAPVFDNTSDLEVCSYDEDCTSELVTLSALAVDDCTDSLLLQYTFSIDIDNDGFIDDSGFGSSITQNLSLGTHRIYWTVADGCGNQSSTDYLVDVTDCKNPTPYCQSSITTAIMPSSGSIEIKAQDYNLGSYDNCTAEEDLLISFSTNVNDTSRVFTCDDIEDGVAQEITLEMWVTDEYGNQERCFITFILQDNGMACEDGTIKGKISGKIATQKNKIIPNIEIDYKCTLESYSGFEMTDSIGFYQVEQAPEYLDYVIKPTYITPAHHGISTIDLLFIQLHLLEIIPFDNPYDFIASDVSGNQKISTSDLTWMRKMILGVITNWPKDQEAWTFVDSAFVFQEMDNPWEYPDSIILNTLKDSITDANFVAIKRGDLNGSFKPPAYKDNTKNAATRSNYQTDIDVDYIKNGDYFEGRFTSNDQETINGLQLSITIPDGAVFSSDFLTENEYYVDNNTLKISWTNPYFQSIKDIELFRISNIAEPNIELSNDVKAEAYIDMEVYNVHLNQNPIENLYQTSTLVRTLENPVIDDLNLILDDKLETDLTIQIFNSQGRVVYSDIIAAGQNHMTIRGDYFPISGVYFLKASNEMFEQTMKLVKI